MFHQAEAAYGIMAAHPLFFEQAKVDEAGRWCWQIPVSTEIDSWDLHPQPLFNHEI